MSDINENMPVVQDTAPAKAEKKRKYTFSGSTNEDFSNVVGNQAINSLWTANSDKEDRNRQTAAVLSAMAGMQPQDEIEGMLVTQMVGMHNASMECLRRAMIKEQSFEGRGQSLNNANKLSRTYAALLDSLSRYRGKGVSEQKVTVQHVHVSDGGQAIVGNVARP